MAKVLTAARTSALENIVALLPEALDVVGQYVSRTEVRELSWLRAHTSRSVLAKLESQQVTGSFKVRGALFALSRLPAGRSVVAPSAGNHGLAIAWAGARLGIKTTIVLPENASALKRERILALGAGVIEMGSTVEAASKEARSIARRHGAEYVSPFNDIAVAAGQATAIIEMLEQHPEIRSLVVPVGGGGLLAGAIAVREHIKRPLRLIAAEPTKFASFAACIKAGGFTRLGRRYTFADGLATNLERYAVTLNVAAGAEDISFLQVTEEQIAAACVGLFNRESVLAEGAGGVAIAAAMDADKLADMPTGSIGTIITGGNIHHATFWRMATYRFTEPRLIALADTLGRSIESEPQRRGLLELRTIRRPGPEAPVDDAVLPATLLQSTVDYAATTRSMLGDIEQVAKEESLPLDIELLETVRHVNERIAAFAAASETGSVEAREQRVRVLSQLAVATRMAFEWRSPAYDQSSALSAFDLGSLGSSGVNYARFEQPGVGRIERQLSELLQTPSETHAVLVTSSGMAAFALAMEVVKASAQIRSVLAAPYVYFEGREMLEHWLPGQVTNAGSYDADLLAAEAEITGSTVVFADPLANHPEQRMVDVERLAGSLSDSACDRWLVVDGTMLPAVTAGPVTRTLPETALYYESCSKYLQFGLDIAMAGLVVVPRRLEPLARRIRRNLGLGLDRYGAELFPTYRPDEFERRMGALEASALRVATSLRQALTNGYFSVTFPGLEGHPDHALARRIERTGSIVTFAPDRMQLSLDQLAPIVDAAIREARARNLPLVNGVSFGFSTSRLSAASALAEGAPPFLRLAVGLMSQQGSELLAEVLLHAISNTTAAWPDPMPSSALSDHASTLRGE